ncbi:MAG: hypothetical protein E6Q40_07925 [Cupriavidus sp.]|uniref:hypothetical protein n=1 Tax=Cupriavidus sp. H19C3 TaxID=3241603 RepID=UPI0011D9244F|nr:MAG: hypothetical protein E6Q40_07925 [Cupriavidus sp.]
MAAVFAVVTPVVHAQVAQGIDITCDPNSHTAGNSAERLICDHALLSMGYRRIFTDQQRLLREQKIGEADIAAFRRQRDACTTLDCLDTVFSEWKQSTAGIKPSRAVVRP